MADIEKTWLANPSRRTALARVAGLMAASPIGAAVAQIDPSPFGEHRRVLSLAELQTAFDFEPVFRGNVTLLVYDYTAHGDGSEFTLQRNRQAFDWVDILPGRTAIPASQVDLSSELLGVKMKFPILIAPTASMVPLHPEGEIGMFQAATAASNTLMILSTNTSTPVAQVAPAAPGGTLWAQFYPLQNMAASQQWMDTYQNAGCNGIVVTVDQQAAVYERTLQNRNLGGRGARTLRRAGAAGATLTGAARYRVNTGRLWYSWDYIDAVRKMVKGPLLLKGIQDSQDARLAIEHGADAIIVSNHGGRSMDYGPSTLEVLPEIAAAVNGRIPILFDSGIRRGADIFKALALGADGVCLGRTARWGLGAFGPAGAQRLIEILQQELVQVAAACGCAKLSDIKKTAVKANLV
ncbi:MAG TPA: alpha-hydroxy acid oxidase [Herpetosiphonaceae bacterium]|nr:alpha-hydroxy acid oxidase [Herpetosiphonaceae bacterium]